LVSAAGPVIRVERPRPAEEMSGAISSSKADCAALPRVDSCTLWDCVRTDTGSSRTARGMVWESKSSKRTNGRDRRHSGSLKTQLFFIFPKRTMEAILIRITRQLLSSILVVGLLTSAAFAAKEDAHELLKKSFQQADLWTQGPVKVVAHVRLTAKDRPDVNLEYTLTWAGPDKWRAEWTANGLDQITVLNNGKLSNLSNQPNPIVQLLQFEAAVEALDGGNPAGPYTMPPLDFEQAKIDTSKKKINNVDAKCLAFGDPLESYCLDAATGHVLTVSTAVHNAEISSFEYSDYATFGNTSYPQTIKVMYAKTLLVEGKITVTRGEKLSESFFAAPEKSTSVDFKSCADVDKNYTAPRLSKSAPAKEPEAAVKAKKFGLVWVMANVDKSGAVTKATAIGGDPDLNPIATAAVQQYKFTPYMRCGEAVEFEKVLVIPFMPPAPIPQL
jgi:TonB-like protein